MPTFSVPPSTADVDLELLPERAVYWRERRTMIVADVHVGKDATFRAEAVPLPLGTTSSDLDRLSRLIHRTGADRLLVLGDLYHARAGLTDGTLASLRSWRQEHRELDVVLVRGNHDRDAGPSPANLDITEHDGPQSEGLFCFQHEPAPSGGPGYIVAGHLHPGVRLHGRGGQRERVPCFHANRERLLLPAFSEFTGLHLIRPEAGDQLAVIAGTDVIRVSPDAVM